jgi:hypothetical protein
MEPCLLCDPNSVPRGNGAAPICAPHRQQARAAFEGAEPFLRAHLEQAYGGELDGWVRQGVLPELTWHLRVRECPPLPIPDLPWRPGRPVQFGRDPDGVVRILREFLVRALEQDIVPSEPAVVLRVGSPDGRSTAGLEAATTREALRCLVNELVTTDRLAAALRSLPIEAAARAVIDATVEGQTEPDRLVTALGVLSRGAQTLAFVRLMGVGETMLVDPLEVAEQAEVGSGEFGCGWWDIRTRLAEPARQWVELLEGRFPRGRQPYK